MIKKINIFLVLLLLFMSIGAVSAIDEGNITDLSSNEAIHDTLEVSTDENIDYLSSDYEDAVAVDDSSSKLSASTHTISQSNYNQYFDSKTGELISSNVKSGDSIVLSGAFSAKNFVFNKTVKISGSSNNKLTNSVITLLSGASGSTISNLNIVNSKDEYYGIFLNSATKCTIKDCVIKNTGKSSYCICLANNANNNLVSNNDLTTYGVTYGHNQRSTPPLVLSGSHYNTITKNKIKLDDANAIYLSSYPGGPLKGGESNHNVITENIISYNVLPTSWSWSIQVMGSYNEIRSNTITGAYRGVSTTGYYNNITYNTIKGLTGADYTNPGVEVGGEYAIVASYNSIVANNNIIGAKIISTGAGISAADNSIVENNYVEVTSKGRGIVASGSNIKINNNIISTESGSGVFQTGEVSGLVVTNNNITSDSGVGILIEKLSSKRMPSYVTITDNVISTGNKYAIDASGAQAGTSEIDPSSNVISGGGLINSPAGVIDTSKPTYIYKGTTYTITPKNIRTYINDNGGLTSEIKDGDILKFVGTFENEVIYVTKGVKITGNKAKFIDSTFKVTTGNVWIDNLEIENDGAERVNAWGIYVNQASGVKITNNKISVDDSKAAYAIYVLESSYVEVSNNELTSEGDYLTFTLLAYSCEDCEFKDNTIHTKGTGDVYQFKPERCLDGNEVCIDGKTYCVDGNELFINGKSYKLEDGKVTVGDNTYCVDGNEICIDGKTYCLDGNEVCIDGQTVCVDGNEVFIDGNKYCLDGSEVCIDGKTYTLKNGKVTVNGITYCVDGNEVSIDGKTYCFDGNEVCIDGKYYCLDCNEIIIEGKSVCIDGNEVFIDGNKYCLDGNEVCIDGETYTLKNGKVTVNGITYCVDGKNVIIGGKTYCFDGNEVTIGGKTYCFDGNEHKSTGSHVVSEIYQTYGILLLYSSNNVISGNDVDVTSQLSEQLPTTGKGSSTNSIVGIDLYFNCHNNTVSDNDVHVYGKDNYIYGMGVLGYYTGHSAPEGQGATNNSFVGNKVDLEGVYCVEGMIVGDESEDTIIDGNVFNLKSDACAYGIYFELSQKSTAINNELNMNAQAIYGIEGYGASSDNIIVNNTINADGKRAYGVLFQNGKNNNISNNKIKVKGTSEKLTVKILDSIEPGYAGIYLMAKSTDNYVEDNEVESTKNYAVVLDDAAVNNKIVNNYLISQKGKGDKGVNNPSGNEVHDNYAYVATAKTDKITVPYMGTGEFVMDFGKALNGATVKFYDADGNEFAQSKVANGVAKAKYKFNEEDIPAQYVFSAKIFKENYKVSTFDLDFKIDKGNIVISAADAVIMKGKSGKITATVSDEFGNLIPGAKVQFSRLNSAGRATPIGTATSNNKGVATISYTVPSSLAEGTHVITLEVNKVKNYNDAKNTSKLIVGNGKIDTVIVMQSTFFRYSTDYYADERGAYFYGTLYDVYGNTVSGRTVQIAINGALYEVTTDDKGQAGLQVNIASSTVYTYSLFFQGDKDYSASLIASSKLSVVKKPTSIIANDMAFKTSDKTKTVTVALSTIKNPYDGKMYLKNDKPLTLTVNGKEYTAQTTDNGVAKFNIDITKAGTYDAVIDFAGDSSYQPVSKSIKIEVSNSPSKNKELSGVGVGSAPPALNAGGALNIVGSYSDYLAKQKVSTSNFVSTKKNTQIVVSASFRRLANDYNAGERGAFFYATLKDGNGKVLAGKTVQIAVNGATYNVVTDSKGRAGLQVNMASSNVYTYALSFSGDSAYNPAKLASSKLILTKKSTSIAASAKSFKASASSKAVSVTLSTVKNPYNGKMYLKAGKTLTLKIDGQTYTARTNANGVATFYLKLTKRGTFSADINFAGDSTYLASNKKISVTIK